VEPAPLLHPSDDELEVVVAQHTGETDYLESSFHSAEALVEDREFNAGESQTPEHEDSSLGDSAHDNVTAAIPSGLPSAEQAAPSYRPYLSEEFSNDDFDNILNPKSFAAIVPVSDVVAEQVTEDAAVQDVPAEVIEDISDAIPTAIENSLPKRDIPANLHSDLLDEYLAEHFPAIVPVSDIEQSLDSEGIDSSAQVLEETSLPSDELVQNTEQNTEQDATHSVEDLIQAQSQVRESSETHQASPGEESDELENSAVEVAPRTPFFESNGNDVTPSGGGRVGILPWAWFGLGASLLGIILGALFVVNGLSVRQALLGVVIGVAFSAIPLLSGTYFGKSTGLSSLVTSRAAFGYYGNIPLAIIAGLFRIAWCIFLALTIAQLLSQGAIQLGFNTPNADTMVLIALGLVLIVGLGVVIFGYRLLIIVLQTTAVFALISALIVILYSWERIHFSNSMLIDDGNWFNILSPIVLIFVVLGIALANSSADLSRYRSLEGRGRAYLISSTLAAVLPAILLMGFGVLLAASDAKVAEQLLSDPIASFFDLVPAWAALTVLISLVLGLFAMFVVSAYSAGLGLGSLALKTSRPFNSALVMIVIAGLSFGLVFVTLESSAVSYLISAITILSVPLAAWLGIMSVHAVIRRKTLDTASLKYFRGIYGQVNVLGLVIWLVSSALGFAFLSSAGSTVLDSWAGFGWEFLPALADADSLAAISSSGVGVLVAFILGILLTVIICIPQILKQEQDAEELQAQSSWLG
ncbi:MAG: cytosine permease, partial [Microbacteriaceae bacterium]